MTTKSKQRKYFLAPRRGYGNAYIANSKGLEC